MYIMGDMNIDLLKYHSHQQTERYLDMIYSLDLLPVITKPTRITNHTATLIEHIYTNNVNRLTSGIVTLKSLKNGFRSKGSLFVLSRDR